MNNHTPWAVHLNMARLRGWRFPMSRKNSSCQKQNSSEKADLLWHLLWHRHCFSGMATQIFRATQGHHPALFVCLFVCLCHCGYGVEWDEKGDLNEFSVAMQTQCKKSKQTQKCSPQRCLWATQASAANSALPLCWTEIPASPQYLGILRDSLGCNLWERSLHLEVSDLVLFPTGQGPQIIQSPETSVSSAIKCEWRNRRSFSSKMLWCKNLAKKNILSLFFCISTPPSSVLDLHMENIWCLTLPHPHQTLEQIRMFLL